LTLMPFRLSICAALLLATAARAQGPPPFELDEPGEASQIVEMFLALNEVRLPSGNETSIASDAEVRVVANRNDGDADQGSLLVCPTGSCAPLPFGGFTVPAGESTGSFWIVGDGAPYTTGLYYADNNGAAAPLDYVKCEAASSYDLPGGTADVRAEVDTPDYGEWREGVGEHGIRASGNVLIHDWVYVDGPGPTATVQVSAAIDPFVDTPNSQPLTNDEFWTTQAYGDLREILDPDHPSGLDPDLLSPTMTQYARLEVGLAIERWYFEEECFDDDEDGEIDYCESSWVPEIEASASALRENYRYLVWNQPPIGAVLPEILSDDTDTLTNALATQATIPTGEWIEVSARVIATAHCDGAFACSLDALTGAPVQLSITSPNGTLVAWHGIAGLQALPEPGAAAPGIVTLLALRLCAAKGSQT
jgi:hypothetical protein